MAKIPEEPPILLMTLVNSSRIGKHIAKTVVKEGLATTSNVVPRVTTFTAQHNSVQSLQEVLVLIRTVGGKLDDLEKRIHELHPYESPEIRQVDSSINR